jgi:hypothetical protein
MHYIYALTFSGFAQNLISYHFVEHVVSKFLDVMGLKVQRFLSGTSSLKHVH